MKLTVVKLIFLGSFFLPSSTSADTQDTMIGALGGIFGKSPASNEFYFIAPHSLEFIGRVYSFESLADLLGELPMVGVPVYWMNYRKAEHSYLDIGELEVIPLSEVELKLIEKTCFGGKQCFRRNEDQVHPALPVPPAKN